MLPYEPIIKNIQSKIRCYERKNKKISKSGKTQTYISEQYIITLKHDQPFQCNEDVTILSSNDYFRMNETLNHRKTEYGEYLDRIISLENDLKEARKKLKYYDEMEVNIKIIKLKRLEREFGDLENKCKKQEKELESINNELKVRDKTIEQLKSNSLLGKMTGLFSDKK
jgi:chromosome segregation ATPase